MFTVGTPHQVKYSDCLHLVFKPINNNVHILINKSTVERARVHMVARLTKINITLGRYFRIAEVGISISGITSLYIKQPSSLHLRPD